MHKSKLLKIGQVSKLLGVSIDTLRRWEDRGKLVPIKTPGGTRFYTDSQLQEFNPAEKINPLNPLKILSLRLPKVFPLTLSLVITFLVASTAIMAVYLAIPPYDSYLSSSNIKPNAKLASVQDMDNTNLNKNAKLLSMETSELIEESELNVVPTTTNLVSYDSWSITPEDCIRSLIEKGI